MKTGQGLHDHIGYWIGRLRMVVHAAFEEALLEQGVSPPQWCVLICVYNEDVTNAAELARYIGIDKGAISRVIDQLEEMGLIRRTRGKNRRTSILMLTDEGKALTPKLIQCAKTNEVKFFDCLNIAEIKTLKSILKKMLVNCNIEPLDGWFENKEK